MMRSKISNIFFGRMIKPVSSKTSRLRASSIFSPVSIKPPGSDQKPLSGLRARWTRTIELRRRIIAPTPGSGCLGYLRLILQRSFNAEFHAVHDGPGGDVERSEIGVAEGQVGRGFAQFDGSD